MALIEGKLNGNGLFLKVVIGVLITGLVGSGAGLIKLYRDVGILQSASSLEKRVADNEALLRDIGTDRDKRTVIIQGFKDDIAELKQDVRDLKQGRK